MRQSLTFHLAPSFHLSNILFEKLKRHSIGSTSMLAGAKYSLTELLVDLRLDPVRTISVLFKPLDYETCHVTFWRWFMVYLFMYI